MLFPLRAGCVPSAGCIAAARRRRHLARTRADYLPLDAQMIVSFLGEEKAVIQRMRTSLIGFISILFLKRELLGVGWLNAWVSWCLFSQREAVSFFYWWMSGRMWDLPSEECSAKLCSWSWQKSIMLGGPWGLHGLFLLSTHSHYDCYGKGVKTNQQTKSNQPEPASPLEVSRLTACQAYVAFRLLLNSSCCLQFHLQSTGLPGL